MTTACIPVVLNEINSQPNSSLVSMHETLVIVETCSLIMQHFQIFSFLLASGQINNVVIVYDVYE